MPGWRNNKAIVELDPTLNFNKNYYEALALRGECYAELKEWQNAIENYTSAMKLEKSESVDLKPRLNDAKKKLKKKAVLRKENLKKKNPFP